MGYSHRWERNDETTFEAWRKALADVGAILLASDVALSIRKEPGYFVVNGLHEKYGDFAIPMFPLGVPDVEFCKTGPDLRDGKQYDKIVVACLCVLAETGLRVGSDGNEDDWEPGREFAQRVLQREIKCPNFKRSGL